MKLQQLKTKLFEFQKQRDTLRLSVLRYLLAEVKNREIELRAEKKEFDDDELLKVIHKQIKQRKESVEEYTAANREDLAKKENREREILEEFLSLVS